MSMNKKRIILTFTLIMALASASFAYGAAVPSDVAGASYEAAVSALMDKGIITGDTNGNFNPDTTLTRAQACVIIVKTMNPPAAEVTGTATQPAAKSDFTDMTGYGWAEGYISYAVKHGVTKGYPDGTFKPGNPVTMNELVTNGTQGRGIHRRIPRRYMAFQLYGQSDRIERFKGNARNGRSICFKMDGGPDRL